MKRPIVVAAILRRHNQGDDPSMETPVTIKILSTFNAQTGWNEQVPLLALSNGEVAICGFSPQAIYTASDLRAIVEQMDDATPQVAQQLTQPQRQYAAQPRQQVQQSGNLRSHLRQQGNND